METSASEVKPLAQILLKWPNLINYLAAKQDKVSKQSLTYTNNSSINTKCIDLVWDVVFNILVIWETVCYFSSQQKGFQMELLRFCLLSRAADIYSNHSCAAHTVQSLSVSFTSQLPVTAELEEDLSKTNTAIHLFPSTLLTVFSQQLGTLFSRGRSIHLTLIHSPSLPMIFFTLFLPSVFWAPLFILTSQPVNLRSLDIHLSTPGHRRV